MSMLLAKRWMAYTAGVSFAIYQKPSQIYSRFIRGQSDTCRAGGERQARMHFGSRNRYRSRDSVRHGSVCSSGGSRLLAQWRCPPDSSCEIYLLGTPALVFSAPFHTSRELSLLPFFFFFVGVALVSPLPPLWLGFSPSTSLTRCYMYLPTTRVARRFASRAIVFFSAIRPRDGRQCSRLFSLFLSFLCSSFSFLACSLPAPVSSYSLYRALHALTYCRHASARRTHREPPKTSNIVASLSALLLSPFLAFLSSRVLHFKSKRRYCKCRAAFTSFLH